MNGTPPITPAPPSRAPRVLWVSLAREWSGAEESLLEILRHTAGTAGIAIPEGPFAKRARAAGWEPLPLPAWSPRVGAGPGGWLAAGAGVVKLARACRAHARAVGADIVAANGLRAGMAASFGVDLPTIWAVRDNVPPGPAAAVARLVARRRGVTLVANSRFIRDQCHRAFGAKVAAYAVHPGVDWPEAVPRLRAELGIDRTVPLVGVVGQIAPWKRQHDALAAVRVARGVHPHLRMVVVGSAKFRPENHAYLSRLRADAEADGGRTVFLGERADLPALYPDLDALLVPSSGEPFGRVAAEALGYGVPVVGAVPGGLAEIVSTPDRGRLVPSGDVARLAAALLEVLDQGRRAAPVVSAVRAQFPAEAAGRNWEGVYRAVLGEANSACVA